MKPSTIVLRQSDNGPTIKIMRGQSNRIMEIIQKSSFAYISAHGHLCLRLKDAIDGMDVVQFANDTDHGIYIHSFGRFNEHEGDRIEDSGKDVIEFINKFQQQ